MQHFQGSLYFGILCRYMQEIAVVVGFKRVVGPILLDVSRGENMDEPYLQMT